MSLKRNTAWNLAGTGLPLLLGAVTIPYLIRTTGIEAFGVLTLVWALIGYFSLFDFGLGRALTQQVAVARSAELVAELPGLVKTGLWFTVFTGVVGGIILTVLASQLALHWLNVSVPLQFSTHQALLIAAYQPWRSKFWFARAQCHTDWKLTYMDGCQPGRRARCGPDWAYVACSPEIACRLGIGSFRQGKNARSSFFRCMDDCDKYCRTIDGHCRPIHHLGCAWCQRGCLLHCAF